MQLASRVALHGGGKLPKKKRSNKKSVKSPHKSKQRPTRTQVPSHRVPVPLRPQSAKRVWSDSSADDQQAIAKPNTFASSQPSNVTNDVNEQSELMNSEHDIGQKHILQRLSNIRLESIPQHIRAGMTMNPPNNDNTVTKTNNNNDPCFDKNASFTHTISDPRDTTHRKSDSLPSKGPKSQSNPDLHSKKPSKIMKTRQSRGFSRSVNEDEVKLTEHLQMSETTPKTKTNTDKDKEKKESETDRFLKKGLSNHNDTIMDSLSDNEHDNDPQQPRTTDGNNTNNADTTNDDTGFPETRGPSGTVVRKSTQQLTDRTNTDGSTPTTTTGGGSGTQRGHPSSLRNSRRTRSQRNSRAYYIENEDDYGLMRQYKHGGIEDKLIYYPEIVKLLPPTVPGQLLFGLLNLIFSADLYYSFHRYSFVSGDTITDEEFGKFRTERRMDEFFSSRRAISLQNTMPNVLNSSLLWFKIVEYEPTPYKSMGYYQYARYKDANRHYRLPVILGYVEMLIFACIVVTFCLNVKHEFFRGNFFDIHFIYHSFEWDLLTILCSMLIAVTLLHIVLILVVWRLTWFIHFKIYDWKKRIFEYLHRRRLSEKTEVKDRKRDNEDRRYYEIKPHSFLHFQRNGELFISLLKWLNVIEFDQNLDQLINSQNWICLTFAMHKYFGLLLFSFVVIFGINLVTTCNVILFVVSIWIHRMEMYAMDHCGLYAMVNNDGLDYNNSHSWLFDTFWSIVKFIVWPGSLFYIVGSYCMYIMVYRNEFFLWIWTGVFPVWLIVYSILTRGYRRIYAFEALGMFALYFGSLFWFIHRSLHDYTVFAWFASAFWNIAFFCWYLSIQFEFHRCMTFPHWSSEYKRDEKAKAKFGGLCIVGAHKYTCTQYAVAYFKKSSKHDESKQKWYNKWFIQRPWDGLKVPNPDKYHF